VIKLQNGRWSSGSVGGTDKNKDILVTVQVRGEGIWPVVVQRSQQVKKHSQGKSVGFIG
jgi:hypothetical protein